MFCVGWEAPKLNDDVLFVEGLVPKALVVFVVGVEPKEKPLVVVVVAGLFVAPKLNPLAGAVVAVVPKPVVVVLGVDPKLKLDVEGVLVFPKVVVVPKF